MAIRLSIDTLYGGAILERLADELQKAIANIQDINTPAKKPRVITMQLKITPNEQRNVASVQIICSSKLQAAEVIETSISMGADIRTGELYAEEIGAGENIEQNTLPGVQFRGKLAKEPQTAIGFNAVAQEQ